MDSNKLSSHVEEQTWLPAQATDDELAEQKRHGFFAWWHRLTAPPDPPSNATSFQREEVRRGRLASTLLFFVLLLGILAVPSIIAASSKSSPLALPMHLLSLCLNGIALVFNRYGRVRIAGVLTVIGVTLGLAVNLVGVPGGLGEISLLLFAMLVLPELVAVSLLPAGWVFIVALLNSLFIAWAITVEPESPDLVASLSQYSFGAIFILASLQFVVAIVTFLWVTSATRAIHRANRNEAIAKINRRVAQLKEVEVQQKHNLDADIQHLIDVHVRALKDPSVRVDVQSIRQLPQIAYLLNNLLSRLQGYRTSAVRQ